MGNVDDTLALPSTKLLSETRTGEGAVRISRCDKLDCGQKVSNEVFDLLHNVSANTCFLYLLVQMRSQTRSQINAKSNCVWRFTCNSATLIIHDKCCSWKASYIKNISLFSMLFPVPTIRNLGDRTRVAHNVSLRELNPEQLTIQSRDPQSAIKLSDKNLRT